MKKTILTICLASSCLTFAQKQSKKEMIMELVQLSGAVESTEKFRNNLFEIYEKQFPQLSKEAWNKIRDKFDITQLYQEKLMPVYDKYYTEPELEAVIKFFKTPLGNSYIKKQPLIMEESIEIGREWGKEIGENMRSMIVNEIEKNSQNGHAETPPPPPPAK